MYTVVLCDDESVHLDKIRDMLETYQEQRQGCELKIECFESAETLLERFREQNYEPDLLLMDIYLQEEFGIAAAEELRSMGNKSQIVFITSSLDHALEAYRVQAAQYLVKPIELPLFSPKAL